MNRPAANAGPTLCWVLPGISYYHHARIQAFARRHAGPTVVLNVSDTCGFREFGRRERIAQQQGVWRDTILTERRSPVIGT